MSGLKRKTSLNCACFFAAATSLLACPAFAAPSLEDVSLRTVNNYRVERAAQLVTRDPNLAARLWETGTDVSLNGNADSSEGAISLKGKLSGEDARLSRMFDNGKADRFSAWVDGNFSRSEETARERDQSLVHFGLDYRFSSATMLGIVGQYDELAENSSYTADNKARFGWLAGPYLVTRLHENLIFDGRFAVGRATSELDLVSDQDRLETERVLLKGQLSGDFHYDDWRVNPALSVAYFEEGDNVYFGAGEMTLAGQDVTLGRVSFGPRFTKTFDLNGGAEITPSLNLQGSWDFDQTAFIDVNSGALNTPDELRARFEGVVTARVSEEREFVIDTFYDGIGNSGWSAFGLKLGMKVMLK
ncbi:MAG: hypothetical protein CMK06_12685 [Ponticaulis sp.]|nr:hypothetical protein [Ponticaulis sp.]